MSRRVAETEQRLEPTIEVGHVAKAEPLQRPRSQAGGVALVAHDDDLSFGIGHVGKVMGAGGIEAPFEDVAVDHDCVWKVAIPSALLDRADVDNERAAGYESGQIGCGRAGREALARLREKRIDAGFTLHVAP